MKHCKLFFIAWLAISTQLFAQNFTRYAPSFEHNIALAIDVAAKADGSITFLANDPIYGSLVFRTPQGVLSGLGYNYKCGTTTLSFKKLIALPDGGYYILGEHQDNSGDVLCAGFHYNSVMMLNFLDILVLRTDAAGQVLWAKSVGGSNPDGIDNAWLCVDGGLIIFSHSGSEDGDNTNPNDPLFNSNDPWVVRLDASGNVLWDFHPLWTLASANYLISGIELTDGNFLIFNVEEPEKVSVYKLSPTGSQLSKTTLSLPENVQGFKQILPYGSDKVLLGGTGEMVAGSFNRAAYLLLIDANGNKISERFLTDAAQDHYFQSMFIEGDEVIMSGSFYNYDFLSIAALALPDLTVNDYQKFRSGEVQYVRNIWPMPDGGVGVSANVQRDFDFQWMPVAAPATRGFVEFEKCAVAPAFSWTNTGNNTVHFTNNSSNDAVDFNWDFGGIGSSFSENPTFTFPTAGLYTVCLKATNQLLCSKEICIEIWVGASAVSERSLENAQVNIVENQLIVNNLKDEAHLEIYNLNGALLRKFAAGAGTFSADISELSSGLHLLVLKNGQEARAVRFLKM